MIPAETITLFFAASVALGLAPGPDNVFVLTQSALHGRMAGLLVVLGLCTGLLVHTAAVALGVAAIFQTSTLAFTVLKMAGAVYLLYLAWQAFRARVSDLSQPESSSKSWRALYVCGVVMNITNPKVAIFFLAFLPQFADPGVGAITGQIFAFGAIFIVATLLVFGAIAWAAGFIGGWLRHSPHSQLVMNRIAGAVFVALALKLAVSER